MRTLVVVMTGACGKIAYSLLSSLCSGLVFGPEVHLDLRLIDLKAKQEALSIIREQLVDCCYSNVSKVTTYSEQDQDTPYNEADLAIFLGALPRKPGQDRNDVYEMNAQIFQKQGQYLDKSAKKSCKSLVVANPTCTNCLVLAHNAPSIPKVNFTALTRLDYNRFVGQTAKFLNCQPGQIRDVAVWGNHSRKELWDASRIRVEGLSPEEVQEKMKTLDIELLAKEMYERGGFIQEKTKGSAYLSATKAISDHLRDWFQGTDRPVPMGVMVPHPLYSVPPGLCFSLPTLCLGGGNYQIVSDYELSEQQMKRILQNTEQLRKQMAMVGDFLPVSLLE